jgi:AcrR family transcriptional regulator
MRLRLLEATIQCLVDAGFAGTSTTLVSRIAGVSRGAQLHHFPTKNDLVVAAVRHLAEQRQAEFARVQADLPFGEGRTRAVLGAMAEYVISPFFTAALELWVAARSDAQLLEEVGPLEIETGRALHAIAVELLGVDETRPGVRELVQATLDLLRGLGLANTLGDDTRRRNRILDQWAQSLDRN